MKKKVVAVTGCRSEYDILFPVLDEMNKDTAFEVSVVVCGAHLSDNFGYTVNEIEQDGFMISDRIHNLIDSDREVGKAKGAGLLLSSLSDSLDRIKPDYVLVVGDREEPIIAAVTCTYLGIPLVHLCGGDRTVPKAGDVDEPIRHATTKMATLHFTMNEDHANRVLKLGEEPWRVYNTGNPALDRFKKVPKIDKAELLDFFGFSSDLEKEKKVVLVIQHVISGEVAQGADQITQTLEAVTNIDCNCIVNYPNTDMGSREIASVIERYREKSNVRVNRHIPRKEFVNLLRNVDLIVGNSSMALLEGSFLKIPAINVGNRNAQRMNGGNVVTVLAEIAQIKEVAQNILFDGKTSDKLKSCKPVYGDGNAAKRMVKILKDLDKSRTELLAKDITY